MNKKYFKITVLFVIFLILAIILNNYNYKNYEKNLYKSNDKIIANILENHPELKNEIISLITNEIEEKEVFKKYGIDKYRDLSYIKENNIYKEKLIYYNFLYFLLFIISISLLLLYDDYKLKKELKSLSKYMNKVLNGNFFINFKDYKESRLSLLKNDIYKLVIRLKNQNEKELKDKLYLKDFLSDISHQLKTPLTSMYVINDILEREKDDKKRKEFLKKNKHQLERIEWLISSLLKMSLLESETVIFNKKNENIENLIKKSLEPINIKLDLKNIKVNIKGNKDTFHHVDFKWLCEALLNILKNALEYTPEGGIIDIYYEKNPLFLLIKIKDSGSGINKESLKHIFKRFYKVNQNSDGVGIGLNMAEKIVKMHNGEIVVTSNENGTIFEIKLYMTKM